MGISFTEFWELYPRKVGRLDAQKSFEKALKAATVAVIIEGTRKFRANCAGKDPQYIPHPATWLNAGRWDDKPVDNSSSGDIAGRWWGHKPEFPPDDIRTRPGRTGALNRANVYVGSEAPQYRKMLDKANRPETDSREFRYDENRGGIWVSQRWILG